MTLRAVDLCWGRRLPPRAALYQVAVTGAHGECLCPGSRAQEGASCGEQTGPEGVMTAVFEDDSLAEVWTRFVTEQGTGSCLPELRGAKTSEKRVVTTPSSEYVWV